MRKVFSSNVTSQIMLVRDAMDHAGVEVTVQNENESLSPVPGFSPPAEIWVMRDGDFEHAQAVVDATLANLARRQDEPDWSCGQCHEANPSTFEICWNCGTERSGADACDESLNP